MDVEKGYDVFIHNITLSIGIIHTFPVQETTDSQSSVCIAMQINKDQGEAQSFTGLHLEARFSHGPLQVGCVVSKCMHAPHGKAKNISYSEVL